MQFHIDNMTCGGCARSVTKAIQSVDAAAQVTVDIPTHTVQVQTTAPQAAVVAALEEAGYPAQVQ
ncbi:heavy-metal-associated domain-containing protein [Comamonas aquatica]|uniref:heavy-metal-associated domain-containing protein n=1 Tax=Comamonas aquatica TaxID=225991 RepID=UPI0021B0A660|nr:heavy-metal-associated domain-containing protein [Comamonas aquatica]